MDGTHTSYFKHVTTVRREHAGRPDGGYSIFGPQPRVDRRRHRRADLELSQIPVERHDAARDQGRPFGHLLDLSPGGVRLATADGDLRVGAQVRVRFRLPVYAGISPFVAGDGTGDATNEWSGWLTLTRVQKRDGRWELAGRLADMREIDRAMLGLYLSAQPLAA